MALVNISGNVVIVESWNMAGVAYTPERAILLDAEVCTWHIFRVVQSEESHVL